MCSEWNCSNLWKAQDSQWWSCQFWYFTANASQGPGWAHWRTSGPQPEGCLILAALVHFIFFSRVLNLWEISNSPFSQQSFWMMISVWLMLHCSYYSSLLQQPNDHFSSTNVWLIAPKFTFWIISWNWTIIVYLITVRGKHQYLEITRPGATRFTGPQSNSKWRFETFEIMWNYIVVSPGNMHKARHIENTGMINFIGLAF